jgi:hypothetical protein
MNLKKLKIKGHKECAKTLFVSMKNVKERDIK